MTNQIRPHSDSVEAQINFILASTIAQVEQTPESIQARADAISKVANLPNGGEIIEAFRAINADLADELQAARWVRIN